MPTEVIGNYQTPPRAFGDEIAQTDDRVIVEATRTSALLLPKANRRLVYVKLPS